MGHAKPDPFAFKRGRMPQGRAAFPRAFRECVARGIDPASDLAWGPVPVTDNLLLALHPAASKWAWDAALVFSEAIMRGGGLAECWYVYHPTRWHLLLVAPTDLLLVRSLAYARLWIDHAGSFRFEYQGIS